MRYLILDLDRITSIEFKEALRYGDTGMSYVLPEEESLAKFKEIWEHGWDTHYYEDGSLNPQKWEDLEKTL